MIFVTNPPGSVLNGAATTNVLAIPAGKKGVYFFDVSSTETNVFNGLTQ
jgi:hypothetical protein